MAPAPIRSSEFLESTRVLLNAGYRTDLRTPSTESFVADLHTELIADAVSNHEGLQVTVLRYGLLNDQSR
jgi:hypothetical protein